MTANCTRKMENHRELRLECTVGSELQSKNTKHTVTYERNRHIIGSVGKVMGYQAHDSTSDQGVYARYWRSSPDTTVITVVLEVITFEPPRGIKSKPLLAPPPCTRSHCARYEIQLLKALGLQLSGEL
jgi:hypothetical protein